MKKLLVIGLCSILALIGLVFATLSYDSAKTRQQDENQIALTSTIARHDAVNRQALQVEQSKGASQALTIKTLCELIAANKIKVANNPTLCQ